MPIRLLVPDAVVAPLQLFARPSRVTFFDLGLYVPDVPEGIDTTAAPVAVVLTLLASGRTNSEIAGDLFVAVGTVKSHVNNIYNKLEARNRAEAVNRARELELLP
jgi:DNA-binding CsgD family transcriptional regulator